MNSTTLRVFLSSAILLITLHSPALAKDSAGVSADNIRNAVIKSDVLDPQYKREIYSSYEKGVVSISLFRHIDATRDDCKIDSVLIARQVIALSQHDIKLVRCIFYDPERANEYWEVEIRAQLLAAFAQGKIGEHELIDSILISEDKQTSPLSAKFAALSYSGILNANSVCKGAYEERRLAINLRLKEIEKQGVELGHFRDDFLRIEDAARREKSVELPSLINALNKSLDAYVQEMIASGQMKKPELRRAKNSIGVHRTQQADPSLGL